MSRRKRSARSGQTYTTLQHWVLTSEAVKAASGRATKLMLRLALRHNGFNNGMIALSVRDAAAEVRCTVNTVKVLFEELERLGLIACTRKGSFSQKHHMASTWQLNWLPKNGQDWERFGPDDSPFMRLPASVTARRPKSKSRSLPMRPAVSKAKTVG